MSSDVILSACKRINSGTVEHFKPWLEVLTSLCVIEDQFIVPRVEMVLTHFLKTIKENTRYSEETSDCLTAVLAMATRSTHCRRWLYDHFKNWIDFLFYPNSSHVREIASKIVQTFVPCKILAPVFPSPNYERDMCLDVTDLEEDSIDTAEEIHMQLLEILPNAHSFANGPDKIGDNAESVNYQRCTQYLRLLRWYTFSAKQKSLFTSKSIFGHLFEMFVRFNDHSVGLDYQRLEMIILWHHIMHDTPANLRLLSRHHGYVNAFTCFVKLSEPVRVYNEIELPIFYGLIHSCCLDNKSFFKAWLEHDNFAWAIHFMFFEHTLPRVMPVLQATVEAALKDDELKLAMAAVLLQPPKLQGQFLEPAGRSVYAAAIQTVTDRVRFCQSGYLDLAHTYMNKKDQVKDKGEFMNAMSTWGYLINDLISWVNDENLNEEQIETKQMLKIKHMKSFMITMINVLKNVDDEMPPVEKCLHTLTQDSDMLTEFIKSIAACLSAARPHVDRPSARLSQRFYIIAVDALERALSLRNEGHYKMPELAAVSAYVLLSHVIHTGMFEKAVELATKFHAIMPQSVATSAVDVSRLVLQMIVEKPLHNESTYQFLEQVIPSISVTPFWEQGALNAIVGPFQANVRQLIESISSSMDTNDPDNTSLLELDMLLRINLLALRSEKSKEFFMEKTVDIFACIEPMLPEDSPSCSSIKTLLDSYKPRMQEE